jgi:hypothetical protein
MKSMLLLQKATLKSQLPRYGGTSNMFHGSLPTSSARHLDPALTATTNSGSYCLQSWRENELYGRVAAAAQSWKNQADKDAVAKRKAALSTAVAASNVEQWAVNKTVHYNEWANFGRKAVVAAFKTLLACFSLRQLRILDSRHTARHSGITPLWL